MDYPITWTELIMILQDRYKMLGGGSENCPIDLNDIDVSEMTSMSMIFSGRLRFKYIDISEWDVSNVTDMTGMFSGCDCLESVGDIEGWDISNVETMRYMFNGCKEQIIPSWYNETSE